MADTTLQIVEQPTVSEASEEPAGETEEPIKSDQINGVMVLTLLDKIIGAVDQIQLTQSQLEERQQEMDGVVSSIQGELAKLTKAHSTTSNTVNKMLEKVRKVSVNVKTVRQNLEKQAGQIKKLESNEAELLKRRNFKVMIYQVRHLLISSACVFFSWCIRPSSMMAPLAFYMGLPKIPMLQHAIYRIFRTCVITGILKRTNVLPKISRRFQSLP